ncbi:alpha/beta hydrolase family esterase [Rhodoferax sp. UBA5149]|uniref:extracellular catalytic domain type 1 short-chain-length polyhydroxyalkanoate depolymerase n=1 Tax=Rhodoferax sp. UBA5149 TaxID=1947379 RepID=UPI0025FF62EA|nr:PHB depolymerase family esterase [Rhodoferax sp. UBA5149]
MNDTLQELMRAATRLTHAGRLNEATQAIQRALGGAAGAGAAPRATNAHAGATDLGASWNVAPTTQPLVLDGCVFEVDARAPAANESGTGQFSSGTHTHAGLTRRYKLYTPPGHVGRQLPLVVMLHGCTQDPDDFAAGTGMNEHARTQGFFVLYPEQSQNANPSRCWNWFKHNHQRRGSGEPALLASLTQAVMKQHGMDARRIFIAGLSAGGAMAALVAAAYPEIFAAVGVHSGLPGGAAQNVAEALAVMKSGVAGAQAQAGRFGTAPTAPTQQQATPTIVFHGDQDQTVHPRNGEQVIAAVLASAAGADASHTFPAGTARVEHGVSAQGRRYTRSTQLGDKGNILTEHWLLHGAGHAWSGGQANGSYTDAKGPDATHEMLRFFFGQLD